MIPKLTDFSAEELRWALNSIQDHFDIEESHAYAMAGHFNAPPHTEYHIAQQWLTKLTEALQEVERQERINSN